MVKHEEDYILIEELESRGYYIVDHYSENESTVCSLNTLETETLLKLIDNSKPRIGSTLYDIREKLSRGIL